VDSDAAVQQETVMEFAHRYEALIGWIVAHCPHPDKFAHTYAGLGFWLIAAFTMRRSLSSWPPLAVIIGLELVNETIDRIAKGSWMWHDTLGDMTATWFWPIVICAALRFEQRTRDSMRGRLTIADYPETAKIQHDQAQEVGTRIHRMAGGGE